MILYKELPISGTFSVPIVSLDYDPNADIIRFKTEEKIRDYTEKLKEDIQKNGLQKPPIIAWHLGEQEKFKVEKGHHRVQAMKELGKKHIPCKLKIYQYRGTERIVRSIRWLIED